MKILRRENFAISLLKILQKMNIHNQITAIYINSGNVQSVNLWDIFKYNDIKGQLDDSILFLEQCHVHNLIDDIFRLFCHEEIGDENYASSAINNLHYEYVDKIMTHLENKKLCKCPDEL